MDNNLPVRMPYVTIIGITSGSAMWLRDWEHFQSMYNNTPVIELLPSLNLLTELN